MSQYNSESRAKLFNLCACCMCHLSQTFSCTMNSGDNLCGLSRNSYTMASTLKPGPPACPQPCAHQRIAGQRVSVCAACVACIDIQLIALHKTEAVVVTLSPKTQTTGTLKKCEDKHAKPKCRRHLRINERPMESHQETNKEELLQCSAESAVPH